jgi:hypothetical protein
MRASTVEFRESVFIWCRAIPGVTRITTGIDFGQHNRKLNPPEVIWVSK